VRISTRHTRETSPILAMTLTDDELPTPKQVEWLYAEMETRLRVLVTELVSPTVRKSSILGTELENMAALVNDHTKKINNMYSLTTKVVETTAALETFREEMTKMDAQVHASCVRCDEEMRRLNEEFDGQQKNLERKESAILHLQRCLDRVTMELNRVLAKQDESVEMEVQHQLDEQRRVAHKMICQLEAKLMNMELQHANLTDQLWGEETGLAKVTGEVKKLTETVESLVETVTILQASRVQPEHLARLREEVKGCLVKAESDMLELRMNVGNVVNDSKEHLRTALETVSTQHSTFMQEVRTSYREELDYSAKLRSDVEAFVAAVKQHGSDVDKRVEDQASRTNNLMSEQQSVIEDEGRKRKRDRTTLDLEIKGIQKRLGGIFDSHAEITKGFEHLRNVVGKLLGAARMQCAVDLQDTEDREKVYLLGMRLDSQKEESAGPMSPGRPPSEKIQPSPRRKPKILGHQPQPIVKVDQRCLACSGSAPTVLSAFKMACLQYNPSPVDFQDSHFSRFELLFRIKDFLGSAADLYEASNTQGTMKRSDLEGTPLATPPSGALAEYSPMSLSLQKDDRTNRLPTLHRSIGKPQSRGKEMIE